MGGSPLPYPGASVVLQLLALMICSGKGSQCCYDVLARDRGPWWCWWVSGLNGLLVLYDARLRDRRCFCVEVVADNALMAEDCSGCW